MADLDADLGADAGVLPVPPPPASPPPGEPQPVEINRAPRISTATVTDKGKPCPQCGSERHKKKPVTCPFKLWTEDFPTIPRLEKEPLRDAQRRIWESVRVHFVENDMYIKKDGWTYLGPPGGIATGSSSSSLMHLPHHAQSPPKPIIEKVTPKQPLPKEEDEEPVKNSKPCPECGVERHKKKPITCPFKLWTEDHPFVPRLDKETIRDAHQRIWPNVKGHFIENGLYVNRPGYGYAGPNTPGEYAATAGGLDNPGPPPPPSPPRANKGKKKTSGRMSSVSGTSETEENKFPKSCPECGLERHKKKPITCPFKLWTVDFPEVPHEPNERPRDAHYRIWEQVKGNFMQNDQYVKPEGYIFSGPPGQGEDVASMKMKTPKRNRDGDESGAKRHKEGEEKESKHCPECGAERHRKRPSTCPFKQWTDDFPSVPRLGREHIRDAQRRIWATVRERFMEGDAYVKRDGWTYTGPGMTRE